MQGYQGHERVGWDTRGTRDGMEYQGHEKLKRGSTRGARASGPVAAPVSQGWVLKCGVHWFGWWARFLANRTEHRGSWPGA